MNKNLVTFQPSTMIIYQKTNGRAIKLVNNPIIYMQNDAEWNMESR